MFPWRLDNLKDEIHFLESNNVDQIKKQLITFSLCIYVFKSLVKV